MKPEDPERLDPDLDPEDDPGEDLEVTISRVGTYFQM